MVNLHEIKELNLLWSTYIQLKCVCVCVYMVGLHLNGIHKTPGYVLLLVYIQSYKFSKFVFFFVKQF